jgi:hypothetical protein
VRQGFFVSVPGYSTWDGATDARALAMQTTPVASGTEQLADAKGDAGVAATALTTAVPGMVDGANALIDAGAADGARGVLGEVGQNLGVTDADASFSPSGSIGWRRDESKSSSQSTAGNSVQAGEWVVQAKSFESTNGMSYNVSGAALLDVAKARFEGAKLRSSWRSSSMSASISGDANHVAAVNGCTYITYTTRNNSNPQQRFLLHTTAFNETHGNATTYAHANLQFGSLEMQDGATLELSDVTGGAGAMRGNDLTIGIESHQDTMRQKSTGGSASVGLSGTASATAHYSSDKVASTNASSFAVGNADELLGAKVKLHASTLELNGSKQLDKRNVASVEHSDNHDYEKHKSVSVTKTFQLAEKKPVSGADGPSVRENARNNQPTKITTSHNFEKTKSVQRATLTGVDLTDVENADGLNTDATRARQVVSHTHSAATITVVPDVIARAIGGAPKEVLATEQSEEQQVLDAVKVLFDICLFCLAVVDHQHCFL